MTGTGATISRRGPRVAAALGAAASLGLALYTSAVESMPELRIYDGYWMMLGAAIAVALAGPFLWHMRREWSLPLVVFAAVLGSWAPLVLIAVRRHMSILERLKGARYLMAADVVGAAIAVGVACLWLAIRKPDGR
ncbi:MAG TPA: hypothetical protein VFZ26_03125 [Gemmatimonadales bacterium]